MPSNQQFLDLQLAGVIEFRKLGSGLFLAQGQPTRSAPNLGIMQQFAYRSAQLGNSLGRLFSGDSGGLSLGHYFKVALRSVVWKIKLVDT